MDIHRFRLRKLRGKVLAHSFFIYSMYFKIRTKNAIQLTEPIHSQKSKKDEISSFQKSLSTQVENSTYSSSFIQGKHGSR